MKQCSTTEYDLLSDVKNISSAIKIQRFFRHFINGRKLRNQMKYKYNKIWKFKPFLVRCVLDGINFRYSTSYFKYIEHIYNNIEIWSHKGSDAYDDTFDISFS